MQNAEAEKHVSRLLHRLLDDYDPSFGLGTMTCSVYDTSWVACVTKSVSGSSQWLFPTSFSYILNSQLPNGGWAAHPGEEDSGGFDSLLSTLAALYCLTQHAKKPLQLRHLHDKGFPKRLEAGTDRLRQLLESWNVGLCRAVGYEVLVPAHLDMLSDEGIQFEFPGRMLLLQMRDHKLAKVLPELLYRDAPLALLHSLEAFHGRKNFSFDKVAHHKVSGSMMASPSATAAYLMHCTSWDDEAEAYLRLVISNGQGKSSGGVPSAYPSTNFELTWVVSTILEAGLWSKGAHAKVQGRILNILEDARKGTSGLVGFAAGIEPDLDDSSKTSTILSLVGEKGFTKSIIEYFDSGICLKTYVAERNPSVSANCNALLAILLDFDSSQVQLETVEKVTGYICGEWSNATGWLKDKWNISGYYPAMLMSRSFLELLKLWDLGGLPQLLHKLLRERVMPALIQCLVRTLQSQKLDGSWGCEGPKEETAYAILTLVNLRTLPLAQFFRTDIISAIDRGRSFLKTTDPHKPEYIWIEKVSFASVKLAEAYITAAMYTNLEAPFLSDHTESLCNSYYKDLANFASQIDKSPLSKHPRWLVLGSWIDSRLRKPNAQVNLAVDGDRQNTKALYENMAFRWVFANHVFGSSLSAHFILDMIDVTMLVHRVIAMADDATLSADLSRMREFRDCARDHLAHHQMRQSDILKNAASEIMTNGTLKLKGKNHGPQYPEGQPGGNTKARESQSSVRHTMSLLFGLLDGPEAATKAAHSAESNVRTELNLFLEAAIARMDEGERDSPSNNGGQGTKRPFVADRASAAAPASSSEAMVWRLIFAFAIYFRIRDIKNAYWTQLQQQVIQDAQSCMATIHVLQYELTRPCKGLVGRRGSEDKASKLLSYERDRFALAVNYLEATSVGQEILRTIEVCADVADQSAKGWTFTDFLQ